MTRCHTLLTLALVFAVALVFSLATPSQAIISGVAASDGDGTSAQSQVEPSGSGGWVVEDPYGGGHQDVYYDPDAGPWIKTLQLPGPAVVGTVYTLNELLHVGGGPNGTAPAWTDYHEEILTPGWTWNPIGPLGEPQWGFTAKDSISGEDWVGVWTYVVPLGNKQVDWTFRPPLPVCTNLVLTKYLVYDGTGDPLAPVIVAQYPTVPEPGTITLLTMAGLGLGFLAWRRRERR